MKKYSVVCCLAAILSTLALAGCSTTNATFAGSSTPATGTKDAPFAFTEAVQVPFAIPLIGYDVSYADATTHNFYLASSQYAGIITLDLNTLTNPAGPTVSSLGMGAFAGSISDSFNPEPQSSIRGRPEWRACRR